MLQKNKAGFTLIELIVTITILAILATLAFLGLKDYNLDARNAKRVNNINNLNVGITKKIIEGIDIKSFVKDKSNELKEPSIGGNKSILGQNYNAGSINYNVLDIKAKDFLDPNGHPYILGYTTKLDNKYEIAATLENGSGEKTSKITGNYSPRKSDYTKSSIVSRVKDNIVFVNDNKGLRLGDIIISDGTSPKKLKINRVSIINGLGNRLTLSGNIPSDATYIKLTENEAIGLIADKDNENKAIINGSISIAY